MQSVLIDETGQRFGRLTVIGRAKGNSSSAAWLCRCDCGAEKVVEGINLRSGSTVSCGCYAREKAAKLGRAKRTHGMRKTRLYNIWNDMRLRCYSPSNNRYYRYGGRGITVCDEWKNSFEAFRDWALANGYRDDLSIDRKDNDGPYAPWNCRWATKTQQANNKENTRMIEFDGQKMSIAEWSRFTGLPDGTIRWRLSNGWDVARALTKGAMFGGQDGQ